MCQFWIILSYYKYLLKTYYLPDSSFGMQKSLSLMGLTFWWRQIRSVHFSSVARLCLTLCDTMDCSTPGFPVHHQLPELATHVHQVGDTIQLSHLLSSLSPPAFSFSQHQGLSQSQFFTSDGQSINASASASALPMIIINKKHGKKVLWKKIKQQKQLKNN